MPYDDQWARTVVLTPSQRELLRSAVVCGMGLTTSCSKDRLRGKIGKGYRGLLDTTLDELESFRPALVFKTADPEHFTFTREGALVARFQAFGPPATPTAPISPPARLRSRGAANREMALYAAEISATVYAGENRKCSSCGHHNDHGIARGHTFLCQVCFFRGRRYS